MVGPVVEGSSVEKSVGLLLLGLGMAAFMLLTILGMRSVERSAERLPVPELRSEAADEVIDFSESIPR
jgi:hypothetical protein